MKKLFCSFLIFALLLSSFQIALATSNGVFSDVSSGHTNADAISYLKDEGTVEGYEDGSYKPDQSMNRAEFLKVVMISMGHEAESYYTYCYADVKNEWFAPYVCKATSIGLVDGYPDGYFRPEQTVNFTEAAKIIANAFSLIIDETDDENWYHKYVEALEFAAAIPTTIGNFEDEINRGEMAEMIWRTETENKDEPSRTYEDIKLVSSIELASLGNGEIEWEIDGYAANGVKVVWSLESGPTYPRRSGDQSQFISDEENSSWTVTPFDGSGKYYIRVCEYTDGACGVYSNEVYVFLTEESSSSDDDTTDTSDEVTFITLTDEGNGDISWTVEGYSEKGYKVVWSLDEGPTYPTRDGDSYQYFSDPDTDSATVTAFDGSDTYYVRVCEYLGGACGEYSNEIAVDL